MAEKILIIDDDLDTLRLVGLMLEKRGLEISAANNGPQAIELAERDQPDLILLDIMMPEMDGYEVARRLRTDPSTEKIPIIMFTAKTQIDEKVMGFEAGADDYLTKPIEPRELFAHVKAVLARSKKERDEVPPSIEPGKTIGVIAAKGGLGVTTVALNLGIAINKELNKEVIISDFRPGQGTITLDLGYPSSEGLTRLIQQKPKAITISELEKELVTYEKGLRLLLSSHQPHDARYLNSEAQFDKIARHLPYLTQYAILDLGPSLPPVSETVLQSCDEVIIILEPIAQTITQSKALISDCVSIGIPEHRISPVLVNRVRIGTSLSWSQVQDQLERNLTAIFTPIPELTYLAKVHNKPIILQQPESLTKQQFVKLAKAIAVSE